MEAQWLQVAGGLGLFLFGMSVMTDGLRGLAGEALHAGLARFTRSPVSGALTGATATAILQSSSATTVAAVGLVSAGLLSFAQALGIVFGANLGTTLKGWLVALLGLQWNIGVIVLPLVLVGAVMRLFGKARMASGGMALAGFGLVFLGIGFLQQGMAGFQGIVTPESFPPDTLGGRLVLVLIGVVITLVTQSSSAGVAAALTAVYTGAISFPQAAAMVIGMDVGTTVTAALATIGGSVDTRRTGYSHVIYNLLTGVGAFLLLTPYVWLSQRFAPGLLGEHPEIALVGFHTLFNLLGVLLVLPLTRPFARLVMRLVPAAPSPLDDRLDRRMLSEPVVAVEASAGVVNELLAEALRLVMLMLQGPEAAQTVRLRALRERLDRTRLFVDDIHLSPEQQAAWQRLNALMHVLDHLQRLLDRCEEQAQRVRVLTRVEEFRPVVRLSRTLSENLLARLSDKHWEDAQAEALQHARMLTEKVETLRAGIMAEVASGRLHVSQGTEHLEAIRWLQRVCSHIARIFCHAGSMNAQAQAARKPCVEQPQA